MATCNTAKPANHPIEIPQGSNWAETYQFVDSTEAPVDCTGWTAEAVLRMSATESVAFTATTVDAPTGQYTIAMDDSVTSDLRVGTFKWQVNLTDGSDDVRWIEGTAKVTDDLRVE